MHCMGGLCCSAFNIRTGNNNEAGQTSSIVLSHRPTVAEKYIHFAFPGLHFPFHFPFPVCLPRFGGVSPFLFFISLFKFGVSHFPFCVSHPISHNIPHFSVLISVPFSCFRLLPKHA